MIDPNTVIAVLGVTTVGFLGVAVDARNKLGDARFKIKHLTSDLEWFKAEADRFSYLCKKLSIELDAYKMTAAAGKSASWNRPLTRYKKRPARPAKTVTGGSQDTSVSHFPDGGLVISSVSGHSSSSSSSCDSSSSSSSSSSGCD